MKFKNNLKRLRKKRGLSQQRASDLIGISRARYSNYELGYSHPSFFILIDIAKFYDVTLDKLLK